MTWRSVAWPVLVFVAGGLTTAALRALVDRWWRRPRPQVRVLGVSFGPKTGSAKIPVPFLLIQREKASPIVDGLKSQMSLKELRDWIQTSQIGITAHQSVLSHVRDLLSRPNLLNPAMSKEEQRRELLQKWQQLGGAMEAIGIAVMRHYDTEIPSRCTDPHPSQWKSGTIHLTAVRDYNLSEIDVDTEAKARAVQEDNEDSEESIRNHLKAVNAMRRLWIHLEPTDLKWFLAKILDYGQLLEDDGKQIVAAIEQLVAREAPDYLRIEALVTNDGDRSLGVWSSACASIPLASGAGNALIPIGLDVPIDEARQMEIVAGNQGLRLVFYSEAAAAPDSIVGTVGPNNLTADRLRSMFEAMALQCRIAVAVEGLGTSEWTLIRSSAFTFGAPADAGLRRDLAQLVG